MATTKRPNDQKFKINGEIMLNFAGFVLIT